MTRNYWGAIEGPRSPLLASAIAAGLLPAEYIDTDRKGRGSCLNYDDYDVSASPKRLLVQRRETTITKYGSSPRKSYALVQLRNRKVEVINMDAHKALIVKLAKAATRPGQVIATLLGETARPVKLPSVADAEYGYKALALVDGELRSVYSGRAYRTGGTYRESAKSDHGGGYYYYRSEAEAMDASVPGGSKLLDAPRVIVRVKVGGGRRVYGSKRSASRMTVLEIVRYSRLMDDDEMERNYLSPGHDSPLAWVPVPFRPTV